VAKHCLFYLEEDKDVTISIIATANSGFKPHILVAQIDNATDPDALEFPPYSTDKYKTQSLFAWSPGLNLFKFSKTYKSKKNSVLAMAVRDESHMLSRLTSFPQTVTLTVTGSEIVRL